MKWNLPNCLHTSALSVEDSCGSLRSLSYASLAAFFRPFASSKCAAWKLSSSRVKVASWCGARRALLKCTAATVQCRRALNISANRRCASAARENPGDTYSAICNALVALPVKKLTKHMPYTPAVLDHGSTR